ncbi:hypothetical protein NP493_694g01070 [Ridgeia piscesae]|uniref:Uncharacterized protein n=1 Tax=Ridgeia piscesae TaxID=27915 RepID=A0AAD9NPK7_RIDPI|nr:hypothetical protein NP493_694g01070 [Ridgeia piscesae]
MLACTKTNLAVIKELVHAGSQPGLRNKDGWNTLHIASRVGKREVIEFLLGRDRDLWNTRSRNGRTPLHTTALHGRLDACEVLLQQGGYNVDEADNCGTTPLMDALRNGHTDIADLLIRQHKADTAKEDQLGRQCLHLAAEAGNSASVVYLNQYGDFNVNSQTLTSGVTPLHLAAKEGHQGMIHLLISLGADVHCKDSKGRTALELARSSHQKACVDILLGHSTHD